MCKEGKYHVLEFHHTNPREHSGRPSWEVVRSWSFDRIVEEYERETQLLCRNCHADAHYRLKLEVEYQDD